MILIGSFTILKHGNVTGFLSGFFTILKHGNIGFYIKCVFSRGINMGIQELS